MSVRVWLIRRPDGLCRLHVSSGTPQVGDIGQEIVGSRRFPGWEQALEVLWDLRKRLAVDTRPDGWIEPGEKLAAVLGEFERT